jgi:preprotein translocase subunit SecG
MPCPVTTGAGVAMMRGMAFFRGFFLLVTLILKLAYNERSARK